MTAPNIPGGQPPPQIPCIPIPGTEYVVAAGAGIYFERDEKTKTWVFSLGMVGGRNSTLIGGFKPVRVKLIELFKVTDDEAVEMFKAEERKAFGDPQ